MVWGPSDGDSDSKTRKAWGFALSGSLAGCGVKRFGELTENGRIWASAGPNSLPMEVNLNVPERRPGKRNVRSIETKWCLTQLMSSV